MTPKEIIRVAQEAGFVIWSDTSRKGMVDWACEYDTELERFAALIAAHEREACAKLADGELMNINMLTSYLPKSSAAWNIAAAIRGRGEE